MEYQVKIALKLKKVSNINEFMQKTEDARLQALCDFIKQDTLKEKN